jgi:hypothetical protein
MALAEAKRGAALLANSTRADSLEDSEPGTSFHSPPLGRASLNAHAPPTSTPSKVVEPVAGVGAKGERALLPDANDVVGAADRRPELSDLRVRHEYGGVRRHDDATLRLRMGGPGTHQADHGGCHDE